MYEIIRADRATGQTQESIGRYDCPTAASEEMNRRQLQYPAQAFYLFLRVSDRTRIIIGHTLYNGGAA